MKTVYRPTFRFRVTEYGGFNGSSGYVASNEHMSTHREFVDEAEKLIPGGIKNVGAIASGGELPLAVFLPRGANVWAVDHAKRSLVYAYLKAMLLDMNSPEEFRTKMLSNPYQAFKEVLGHLPTAPFDPQFVMSLVSMFSNNVCYPSTDLQGCWNDTPIQLVEKAKANLRNLTLIYGDFYDLAHQGVDFDLLYTSNATNVNGRNGCLQHRMLTPMLKPGGLFLTTGNLDKQYIIKSKTYGSWNYRLASPVSVSQPVQPIVTPPPVVPKRRVSARRKSTQVGATA